MDGGNLWNFNQPVMLDLWYFWWLPALFLADFSVGLPWVPNIHLHSTFIFQATLDVEVEVGQMPGNHTFLHSTILPVSFMGKTFCKFSVFFFLQLAEVFQCSCEYLTGSRTGPKHWHQGTSLSLFWPVSLLAMVLLRCWFFVLKSGVNCQWLYLFQLSSPFISTIV